VLTIGALQHVAGDGTPVPQPRDDGRLAWEPEPAHRQLVEIMLTLGHSQEAICREFASRNLPCRTTETLRRIFHEELAHGRERRVAGYGVKLHTIAMGNSPSALSALKYLLSVVGGEQWRVPKDDGRGDDQTGALAGERHRRRIYIPARDPEPEDDVGPIIEGEVAKAAA
jgi:hypothetical protein